LRIKAKKRAANENHITQEILVEYWYTIPPCRTHSAYISRRYPVALRTGYLREMYAECTWNLRERGKLYTNFMVDFLFLSLSFIFWFFRVSFNEIGLHRSLNITPSFYDWFFLFPKWSSCMLIII